LAPGWIAFGGPGKGFSLALPIGWSPTTPSKGNLFEADGPGEGGLFIMLDTDPGTQDFNTWLAAHITRETTGGVAPPTEHVTLAGGPAIRDEWRLFPQYAEVGYYLPAPGKGVLYLGFQTLNPAEPAIWAQIAATLSVG
jgi:hypothetical protein